MRVKRPPSGPVRGASTVLLAAFCGFLVALVVKGPSLVGKLSQGGSRGDLKAAQEAWQWSLQEELDMLSEQVAALTKERDLLETAKLEEVAKLSAERDSLRKELASRGQGVCTDRHQVQGPDGEKDQTDPELAAFLRKVAPSGEVLVAVCNQNYAGPGGMLELWARNVQAAGVKNAMVVALDDPTKAGMDAIAFPAFRMDLEIPESQRRAGSNHATSALKFRILSRFLNLGYSVFLSDVDIVTLQNPFPFLTRDSDVESMSDGWDNGTAYGYNDVADDPSMGWARYAHSMRVFVFNSGLFFIRPSRAAMDLVELVVHRVETEAGWDQALFNECIFFPNRPGYKDPGVTRRVLDYYLFMNSKVLFKQVRHDPRFRDHRPVMIHINYHPNKFERMNAVVARYVHGDMHALDQFPDGSE